MASDYDYKEARYDLYCRTCKHWKEEGYESECEKCLDVPINLYSEKPTRYEEDETRKEK